MVVAVDRVELLDQLIASLLSFRLVEGVTMEFCVPESIAELTKTLKSEHKGLIVFTLIQKLVSIGESGICVNQSIALIGDEVHRSFVRLVT